MIESKTVIDPTGKVLLFGIEDFYEQIVKGNHCFMCGAPPGSKPFNNEHIIPDWILRRHDLYNQQITLPNSTFISYRHYTVPCCLDCNLELGTSVEKPVSELLGKTYEEISDAINQDYTIVYKLFHWLSLIYLKTHLKDTNLRMERDLRLDAGMIGDYHPWETLHHIHCMARTSYTGAKVHFEVYGSMFFVPVFHIYKGVTFDYLDSVDGKTMLIQLGDFCMIAVLDDACAGWNLLQSKTEKLKGPLTHFQLREVVTHLNYINMHLKHRPQFYSRFGVDGYEINVKLPEKIELLSEEDTELPTLGSILHFYVERLIPVDTPDREQILEDIKAGKRSYLFDQQGVFQDPRNALNEAQS